MTWYRDEGQIRWLLRMDDLIPAKEKALIDFSAEKTVQVVRNGIELKPLGGFLFLMPGC
jgi:hypothetical protein